MGKWIPQIVGWLIPALVSLALMYTRLAVVEHIQADHERRIEAIESEMRTYNVQLAAIATIVTRIDSRMDQAQRRR